MMTAAETIDALLKEGRTFPPPREFRKHANIADAKVYARAAKNPEKFWEGFAKELFWFKRWKKVCDWKPPFAKWFVGGQTNLCYNCVDRHLAGPRRNKAAIIWEGEPGDTRVLTYWDLYREVCRFAGALKSLGVKRGDRVTLYLPMIPELAIAMLACARIGAAHSVVFGGFSAEALQGRINDSQSKVVVTADGGYRRGQLVPLKKNTDDALANTPGVEKAIVIRRTGQPVDMKAGRDVWYHELKAEPFSGCERMDSEDLLYILYTSGTTGKPKGIVHTTGGMMVGVYATTQWVFDLKEDDTYWCTADIGWVTGHSYVVYGPLANGASVVMYEGAPDWPDRDRFWALVEKYGVTVFYTAPTAIRAFMKWGEDLPSRHDLSSLRLLGSVGEPINPEAWMWYHRVIGGSRCPIVDTWWQTETGHILITPLPGLTKLKPGSATRPFPGIDADVWDETGKPVPPGKGGFLVIKKPWPGMLRGIFGDEQRYVKQYWSNYKNVYFAGDGCRKDKDGCLWLLGRVDDVLKVAGHRLSTMELESALVDHPAVAEAAVIGKHHEIKENAIVAFVTLKQGHDGGDSMEQSLKEHVVKKIGSIARPDQIILTPELPKTRSGKIMRRLLRDIAEGRAIGDTTTLADGGVLASLKAKYADEE